MSASDDDDDPQLRSPLRDVWRSLPDEEPPDRGLGELMAAARAKAEEMGAPTWWQRFATLFKRPPVLALATIVILIGGAIVIGRRHDAIVATPPRTEPVAAGSSTASEDKAAEPPAPAEPLDITPRAEAVAVDPAPANAVKAPKRPKHRVRVEDLVTPHKPLAHAGQQPVVHEEALNEDGATGAVEGWTNQPLEQTNVTPPSQPEQQALAGGMKTATQAPADSTLKTTASPTNLQLLAQCRSAASRSDCAAVREIARKLAGRDAKFYRANVANDAQLKPCLAP